MSVIDCTLDVIPDRFYLRADLKLQGFRVDVYSSDPAHLELLVMGEPSAVSSFRTGLQQHVQQNTCLKLGRRTYSVTEQKLLDETVAGLDELPPGYNLQNDRLYVSLSFREYESDRITYFAALRAGIHLLRGQGL